MDIFQHPKWTTNVYLSFLEYMDAGLPGEALVVQSQPAIVLQFEH